MEPITFPRNELLKDLDEVLSAVCEKRFIDSRPSVVSEHVAEYIIIRNATGIRDQGDTYQTARLNLQLFVRDRAGEVENSYRLDQMLNAISALCPIVRPRFTADYPNPIGVGADSGFHYITLQLSVVINKRILTQ